METLLNVAQAIVEVADAQRKAGDKQVTLNFDGSYMRRLREAVEGKKLVDKLVDLASAVRDDQINGEEITMVLMGEIIKIWEERDKRSHNV